VTASQQSFLLGDCILTYSNDGASCTDRMGKAVWNETFEMQHPIVSHNGATVAIGDYDGRQIYIMNTGGTLGTVTTNLPIKNLSVSEDGYVAVVLDDKDITWINLYDYKGENPVICKTTMSQSGYPFSISLSPNSNLLMVSYLALADNGTKSSVAFYNFGEVGQNEIDNYMSGYDYQSLVPDVNFMTSDLAYAVSTDRLMFFEGGQKPVSKAEVLLDDEVQSVYNNKEYVALVSYDVSGANQYVLRVYDSSGNNIMTKGFDLLYRDIVMNDDYIYIYSDTDCLICSTSGVEKYAGTMNGTISLIIPGDRVSDMTVVGSNGIETIKLK